MARSIAPIRRSDPRLIPRMVGREAPASGKDGCVPVGVDVGVAVDVDGQPQSDSEGQDGFLQ